MKELEQEPFDPEEFVERLAWRTVADSRGEGTGHFDPLLLHETFLQAIKDLQLLQERQQKKCERLEMMCREEENGHWQQISQLQDRNKASVSMFQELDERINYVATKVIHLGDQLESVNTPRARAVEAQKLMNHFAEFLNHGPLLAEVFTDKSQIDEAADIIQKLHLIAQELPSGKFEIAKKKIASKYDEIERSLIEEFVKAHRSNDKGRMKEIASILSHFKGYPQCIDAFIEQSQMGAFTGKDIFRDVIPLCEKNFTIMTEVFSNPDQVMAKFVLNIYHLKLQKYIVASLSDRSDTDRYLKKLWIMLYKITVKLSNDLLHFQMGNDNTYLSKLTMNIFQKYLDSYISVETKCLKEKNAAVLQKYYDSKNHQKKQLQTGGFHDLRRDLQAVIGTRANFNIAQIENYGGETFLSEEVAIALLQESKLAFRRCEMLSRQSDMPGNALQVFEILLHFLMAEHLDYALELGLQSVPIPENKTHPQIYFFDVVRQCNAIIHLLEKQFIDSLVPLVISTPKHGDCLQKKKYLLEQIELKLDTGLDRSINAIVGWVKIYLQTEQKKTDFPETDLDTLASPACLAVVQYVGSMVERIRDSLDGKNVEALMMELGVRFHRVIYEHLQQFQYNSAGAMCAICDVNEYRKCVKEFKIPLVNTLFDTLHALCNLLLVKPENLKQVCTGDQLAGLDRSILLNFIQLRSDYKTQKLAVSLKGLAT
ncbi:hypothetical protein L9F63_004988 [Diploptera punctata]|uniref:Exocyst complex component 5 n=1 Tax=Diploptera punctata TaxID=6984 RepID=A0AAD7ZDN8_DIPPU|nr:hypothetical protein L9F63_004988 [Diploptera punctata]